MNARAHLLATNPVPEDVAVAMDFLHGKGYEATYYPSSTGDAISVEVDGRVVGTLHQYSRGVWSMIVSRPSDISTEAELLGYDDAVTAALEFHKVVQSGNAWFWNRSTRVWEQTRTKVSP